MAIHPSGRVVSFKAEVMLKVPPSEAHWREIVDESQGSRMRVLAKEEYLVIIDAIVSTV